MVLKWSHIIKGGFIIGVLIYGLYLAYRNSQMKAESTFQNINYISGGVDTSNILYSIPGSIANPNMIFGPNYLPLESNVPAIDVLRSQKQIPTYHKQLIQQAY